MIDPLSMLRPRRPITGISAILLPFLDDATIDWPSFEAHVLRTADAGLTPAVNMDTGYVNLLSDAEQNDVLDRTKSALGGRPFVAGAFVGDRPGDAFDGDGYKRQIESIEQRSGLPVIFPSYGLSRQGGEEVLRSYREIATACDRFLGFELTTSLAPFGAIYDLETYAGLMEIPQCVGAKHSSFHREPEWQRLKLRDAKRPDFTVYTGNDFAIDMLIYGSDYLLGLSTFAPDLFAKRDALWEAGDAAFYELNDLLQYLGMFAFRSPGPGYKHNAAQFLKLRGWTTTDRTHPKSVSRPDSDVVVLREIGERLGVL
ncbi:MAG: dihydrodipicolinate synthase family protein [Planctomycetaceae bacterium]